MALVLASLPCGASDDGEMYVTALTNLDPARRMDEGVNGEVGDGRPQEIAVESRDAERTMVSVGEATARTYESPDQTNPL